MADQKKQATGRRDLYAEETRTAMLVTAQRLFTEIGFQQTSVEVIARSAQVTRGAFYHHFSDKRAVFDAVVVLLQQQAVEFIQARTLVLKDVKDRLFEGIEAYLELMQSPTYLRIVVTEAPAVLGTERFRAIDAEYPVGLVIKTLNSLGNNGRLAHDEPETLARIISAMTCEAGILIASSNQPNRQKAAYFTTICRAIEPFIK